MRRAHAHTHTHTVSYTHTHTHSVIIHTQRSTQPWRRMTALTQDDSGAHEASRRALCGGQEAGRTGQAVTAAGTSTPATHVVIIAGAGATGIVAGTCRRLIRDAHAPVGTREEATQVVLSKAAHVYVGMTPAEVAIAIWPVAPALLLALAPDASPHRRAVLVGFARAVQRLQRG